MAIDIKLPLINGKTDAEQIYQIKRYLYQLAEELKYNLNTLEAGTSDEASLERVGIIDSLNKWRLGVSGEVGSIATIRQTVSKQGASILALTDWQKGAINSISKIEQISTEDYASITGLAEWKSNLDGVTSDSVAKIQATAERAEASIGLLVDNGAVKGSILISAINDESVAKISADRLDIEGKTLNIKVDATNIDGTLTAKQVDVTGILTAGKAQIEALATGVITAEHIITLNLEVGTHIKMGANATISWDSVDNKPSDLATTSQVTTITNNTIKTTDVLAENLKVNAANIKETLTANQVDVTGILTAGKAQIEALATGVITAERITTLGLEVGTHIKMGANARISWDSVDNKPSDLATTSQVTTITNNTIKTTDVLAENLKVKATLIDGLLTASQISVTDLNAFGATIGGFTIDNNSLHTQMGSTSNRILLCSGTSARYTVGDFTSTGWSILAGSNFGVLKNGTAYMRNANIEGTLKTGNDDFNVTVGDGFVHVKSAAFYDKPQDSGQKYLILKFDTEDGHTWGLFATGAYNDVDSGNVAPTNLSVERIDRAKN